MIYFFNYHKSSEPVLLTGGIGNHMLICVLQSLINSTRVLH